MGGGPRQMGKGSQPLNLKGQGDGGKTKKFLATSTTES